MTTDRGVGAPSHSHLPDNQLAVSWDDRSDWASSPSHPPAGRPRSADPAVAGVSERGKEGETGGQEEEEGQREAGQKAAALWRPELGCYLLYFASVRANHRAARHTDRRTGRHLLKAEAACLVLL